MVITLIKLWNFIKTEKVSRFTCKYFYLLFMCGRMNMNARVIKLMELRIEELEAEEAR